MQGIGPVETKHGWQTIRECGELAIHARADNQFGVPCCFFLYFDGAVNMAHYSSSKGAAILVWRVGEPADIANACAWLRQ